MSMKDGSPRLLLRCQHEGPSILGKGEALYADCMKQKGHTGQHHCFSDDGSVELRWEDGWSLAEGEWRTEGDDEGS